jgi:hypothetical protein
MFSSFSRDAHRTNPAPQAPGLVRAKEVERNIEIRAVFTYAPGLCEGGDIILDNSATEEVEGGISADELALANASAKAARRKKGLGLSNWNSTSKKGLSII